MATNNIKYVITGINKMTGEREPVTKPHGITKIMEMRDKLVARQNCRSAYRNLKIEVAIKEGDLWK